jgi:hypothetical protein
MISLKIRRKGYSLPSNTYNPYIETKDTNAANQYDGWSFAFTTERGLWLNATLVYIWYDVWEGGRDDFAICRVSFGAQKHKLRFYLKK